MTFESRMVTSYGEPKYVQDSYKFKKNNGNFGLPLIRFVQA
jgi:hypothetical protein